MFVTKNRHFRLTPPRSRILWSENAPPPRFANCPACNVGDIIVDGDDIYGDGVNVAARIQALADPGGIYISRGAAEQVPDKVPIKLETRGEQTVKNIARPIEVFRTIAEGPA